MAPPLTPCLAQYMLLNVCGNLLEPNGNLVTPQTRLLQGLDVVGVHIASIYVRVAFEAPPLHLALFIKYVSSPLRLDRTMAPVGGGGLRLVSLDHVFQF